MTPEIAKDAMRPETRRTVEGLMAVHRITQRDLARAIGMPASELSTMLRGCRGASLHHLYAIAATFGVTVGELLDGDLCVESLADCARRMIRESSAARRGNRDKRESSRLDDSESAKSID